MMLLVYWICSCFEALLHFCSKKNRHITCCIKQVSTLCKLIFVLLWNASRPMVRALLAASMILDIAVCLFSATCRNTSLVALSGALEKSLHLVVYPCHLTHPIHLFSTGFKWQEWIVNGCMFKERHFWPDDCILQEPGEHLHVIKEPSWDLVVRLG